MEQFFKQVTIFIIGLVPVIALPLTDLYHIPHFRGAAFGFIVLLFVLYMISGAKLRTVPWTLISIFAFAVWVALGVMYTRASNYGGGKAFLVASYYGVLGYILYQLVDTTFQLKRFLYGMLTGGLFTLAILFYEFGNPISLLTHASRFYRLHFGEQGNPILLARSLGMTILLVTWFIWQSPKKLFQAAWGLPMIMALASYLVLTGSKGPIISLGIGICAAIFLLSRYGIPSLAITAIALLFLGQSILSVLPSEFVTQRFLQKSGDLSHRLPVYLMTWEAIVGAGPFEFLIGHGTGDFGYFLFHKDARQYPHNIFFEVMYENGLIGIILFLFCIGIPLRSLYEIKISNFHGKEKPLVALIGGLFVMALINAQVTADLGQNQFIGILGVLAVALSQGSPMEPKTKHEMNSIKILSLQKPLPVSTPGI